MDDRRRSFLIPGFCGVAILIAVLGFLTLVPLTECEDCDGDGFIQVVGANVPGRSDGAKYVTVPTCPWCRGGKKRPLWDIWTPEYPTLE